MALSNTAVPKYYGMFRDAVIRGEIPVCKEISMEMNRIDDLIANPGVYYDDQAVEGWIAYCESELTLTDGSDLISKSEANEKLLRISTTILKRKCSLVWLMIALSISVWPTSRGATLHRTSMRICMNTCTSLMKN